MSNTDVYGDVYSTKPQALFEAWLRNGVFFKQNDSYYVFSKQRAKNQINILISEQNYPAVREIANQLKVSISLSDRSILKSVRVPFATFLRLVNLALTEKLSLSTVVGNAITKDLDRFITDISTRADIDSNRLDLLRKALKTWEATRSKTEQTLRDFYSPSIGYYPLLQKKTLKTILVKGIEAIKDKCPIVPRELLDEYLEVEWEKNVNGLYQTYPELFEVAITLDQDGKVALDISFSGYVVLNMDLDEYNAFIGEVRNRYGHEKSRSLEETLDVDEDWADEIGQVPLFFKLDLLSVPIEVKGDDLLLAGVVLKDEHSDEEIRFKYLEDRDKLQLVLRSNLSKASQNYDWNKVSEISSKMIESDEKFELLEYCLSIVFKLLHKKHVISFRAPEIIVRAWEASGANRLGLLGMGA